MDTYTSNIILVIYIAFWLITTVIYQRRKKYFDAGSIILFSYLFYSIVSLVLYNASNPFNDFNPIKLFPFIYLFSMIMLTLSPVLRFDANRVNEIQEPNKLVLNIFIIIFIIASLIHLPTIISNFSDSIYKLLTTSYGGQDLYNESLLNNVDTGDAKISNLSAIISGLFSNLGFLLFFYYLTLKKRNKLILFGLISSFIVSLMTSISLGQRGLIAGTVFTAVVSYLLLKKFIQPKVQRIINIGGIILGFAIAIPLTALTVSRFGDGNGSAQTSLYYYIGQANLYFNNYGLDNNGIRYGDRIFPLFKRMLGFENTPINFWERREKYPNLNINDEVFSTFVGDFTFDFGPVIAVILFIVFTYFITKNTKISNGNVRFHQLILLHFVVCVCMIGGLKLYPFSDTGGNLQLIVYAIAYFLFKYEYILFPKKNTF